MHEPQRLAQVFVELADTLVEEFDVVDFLQTLTERCVELRGHRRRRADARRPARRPAGWSPTPTSPRGCWSCSSCRTRRVPAWTASPPVGRSPTSTSPTAADRWPVFAASAAGGWVRHGHALPLRLRRQVIGALNLFSTETGRRSATTTLPSAQAMADVATIGLLHERSRARTGRPVRAAADRPAQPDPHRAGQGGPVGPRRPERGEAFTRMRAHARRTSTSLTSIAQAVVEGTIGVDVLTPG